MDRVLKKALKHKQFKWLPKHLNHITENIVFKKRNVSFLAINAVFRTKDYKCVPTEEHYRDSFQIRAYVPLLKNDALRKKAEELTVIFKLDRRNNIIVITAFSKSDQYE